MEKRERRIALMTVILPFAGFLIAVVSHWKRGIDWYEMLILGLMYTLSVIGIGVGYHRLIAHRAFETHAWLRLLLVILGSMAGQGPVLFWVALHRQHHKYSDRTGDPHSPHLHGEHTVGWLKGLWHAHIGWMLNPQPPSSKRLVIDLLHESGLVRINRTYFYWLLLGILIPMGAEGILLQSWAAAWNGLLWGGLIRIFIVHHVTWSINSICHLYGSRPFQGRDQSTNNFWLALPSFGESWHNNHHAFPNSARHGLKWWQIDINGWLICGLRWVGLAWNIKGPSDESIALKVSHR